MKNNSFTDYSGHITLESMSQAVWYNTWTAHKFAQFLTGDILEVGCGIGNFTPFLCDHGSVWAIDVDKTCILKTKRTAPKKARVGFGDIENHRFFFRSNKQFDSIVCLNVLEHIKKDKQAMSNMVGLLKPNGYLIVLIPSHPSLYGDIDKSIGHYRRYSKPSILSILPEVMSLRYIRLINFFGSLGWFMSGKILHTKHVSSNSLKIFNLFAPFLLRLEDLIEPPIGTSILMIAQKK